MTDLPTGQERLKELEQYLADVERETGTSSIEAADALDRVAEHLRQEQIRLGDIEKMERRSKNIRSKLSSEPASLVNNTTGNDAPSKKCPFCAEDIRVEAIKCRFCGSALSESSTTSSAAKTGSIAATPATAAKSQSSMTTALAVGAIFIGVFALFTPNILKMLLGPAP